MLIAGDVGLFQHAIAVFADQEVRDVFLEDQLRWFLSLGHGQFFPPDSGLVAGNLDNLMR